MPGSLTTAKMSDAEEDYELEYSEDDDSQPDVDLENQYYNSKVRKNGIFR